MPKALLTFLSNHSLKSKNWKLHLLIIFIGLILDQSTKYWAVKEFSLPSGDINYAYTIQIAGEWMRFRLVYNSAN